MKQKVALVLSGGGARGIAHIGVIEELEKRGFEIASIAGTSMGAVVGGVYVLGKMEEYKEWLSSLDKFGVFGLFDFTLSWQGFVKGDKVFNRMKEYISDGNIEDMRIPFAAVAADIISKKEVVFTSGSVFDAIRASVSIPTVFTPVKHGDGLLVDGGVMNNIPVNHVSRTKGDLLVVVNVNADIPVQKKPVSKKEEERRESVYQKKIREFYGYVQGLVNHGHTDKKEEVEEEKKKKAQEHLDLFNLINRTLSSMTYTIGQMRLEQHKPDILVEVSVDSCGLFDFYKAEDMVEIGRHAAALEVDKFSGEKRN